MSLAEDSRADQQAEEYLIIWDHIREGENLISFVLFNHLQLYLVLWNVHETYSWEHFNQVLLNRIGI